MQKNATERVQNFKLSMGNLHLPWNRRFSRPSKLAACYSHCMYLFVSCYGNHQRDATKPFDS